VSGNPAGGGYTAWVAAHDSQAVSFIDSRPMPDDKLPALGIMLHTPANRCFVMMFSHKTFHPYIVIIIIMINRHSDGKLQQRLTRRNAVGAVGGPQLDRLRQDHLAPLHLIMFPSHTDTSRNGGGGTPVLLGRRERVVYRVVCTCSQ
jgi:hypothetical protein